MSDTDSYFNTPPEDQRLWQGAVTRPVTYVEWSGCRCGYPCGCSRGCAKYHRKFVWGLDWLKRHGLKAEDGPWQVRCPTCGLMATIQVVKEAA